MSEKVDAARELVSWTLGPVVLDVLLDGQPEGTYPDWGYDEQLIVDVAEACAQNLERRPQGSPPGKCQDEVDEAHLRFRKA